MTNRVAYANPEGVHAPAGLYTHGVLIPPEARTLMISGQVGIRPDGSLGATVSEQADQIFQNIGIILKAHDMDFPDIVKLGTYMVFGQLGSDMRGSRRKHMGEHRPSATFIYVPQLFLPEWLLEVEAIAAKI